MTSIADKLAECGDLSTSAPQRRPADSPIDARTIVSPVPRAANMAEDLRSVAITFRSIPALLQVGDDEFEVVVTDDRGNVVTGVSLTITFRMPASPAMDLPELRTTIPQVNEQASPHGCVRQ